MLVLSLMALSACAAGPNGLEDQGNSEGLVAGFWRGLWNGFISPVTFIISLFDDDVHIYEVHNNGNWYNFGFMVGVSFIFGSVLGGSAGAGRARRCS
jgi:hypothetical protein